MENLEKYDVLIIGGGPIGLACGMEAKKRGLRYVILEKGCLANSIYRYPVNMTFFSTSEKLEIGGIPFVSHGDKPTRREALEYYRRAAATWELNIHLYEPVQGVTKKGERFVVNTEKAQYGARAVILATGFYDLPNMMGVPGEDLPKVKHYYDDPHLYAHQKVLVVGAANSAIDAALETYRKNAEVTLVIRSDKVSDRVKYWIKPDIENRIKEGSIKAYFQSEVKKITPTSVEVDTPEGLITVPNDFVLAMTGYHPDFGFLAKLGIELDEDDCLRPSHSESTYETNIAGLYLAGVVCGGMKTSRWFIENSREHAEIVMKEIAERVSNKKSGVG